MYRDIYFSILRHIQSAGIFLALSCLAAPISVFADDTILIQFTNSMTMVYVSSKECVHTIAPGPTEYMKLITDYLNILYPAGVSYWVLPETTQPIEDKNTCIAAMQKQLMEYQMASSRFSHTYPEQPAPPVLLAYNWANGGSAPPQAFTPAPPAPPPKELPAASPWK